MNEKKIALRYAKALHDCPTVTEEDLVKVSDLIRSDPSLIRFLKAPQISIADKSKLLSNCFGTQFPETVLCFLSHLLAVNRFFLLDDICQEYQALMNISQGQIYSAIPISEMMADEVKKKIETSWKRKIRFKCFQNPSLIGGLVIQVDNEMLDMSVKESLNNLKQQLGK